MHLKEHSAPTRDQVRSWNPPRETNHMSNVQDGGGEGGDIASQEHIMYVTIDIIWTSRQADLYRNADNAHLSTLTSIKHSSPMTDTFR